MARSCSGSMPILRFLQSILCRHRTANLGTELDPDSPNHSEVSFTVASGVSDSSASTVPRSASEILARPGSDPRAELIVPAPRGEGVDVHGLVGIRPEDFGWSGERDEIRYYSVWIVPRTHCNVAGIHWGRGLVAYSAILKLNDGQFEGIRWHRHESLQQAQESFRAEAHRFNLPPTLADRIVGGLSGQ